MQNANNPWPGPSWASAHRAWTGRLLRGRRARRQPVVFAWHPTATAGLVGARGAASRSSAWKDWLDVPRRRPALAFLEGLRGGAFAFYGKVLSGTPEQRRALEARAQDSDGRRRGRGRGPPATSSATSRPQAKAKVQEMVKQHRRGVRPPHRRARLDGARHQGRGEGEGAALYVGVGYPDHWPDYSGLEVRRGDPLGNVERAELFDYQRQLAKLGKPVDRTEWCMLPHTVNAVNLPLRNALNFPAGILQPPFFDRDATGGRELRRDRRDHRPRDQPQLRRSGRALRRRRAGSGTGGRRRTSRTSRPPATQLAAQYDAVPALPGPARERQADAEREHRRPRGARRGVRRLARVARRRAAPVVKGFSGEQQFFLAFAQTWRTKIRDPLLRQLVVSDGHAPGQYRADDGPELRRLVCGVRGEAGGDALPGTDGAGPRVVICGMGCRPCRPRRGQGRVSRGAGPGAAQSAPGTRSPRSARPGAALRPRGPGARRSPDRPGAPGSGRSA